MRVSQSRLNESGHCFQGFLPKVPFKITWFSKRDPRWSGQVTHPRRLHHSFQPLGLLSTAGSYEVFCCGWVFGGFLEETYVIHAILEINIKNQNSKKKVESFQLGVPFTQNAEAWSLSKRIHHCFITTAPFQKKTSHKSHQGVQQFTSKSTPGKMIFFVSEFKGDPSRITATLI